MRFDCDRGAIVHLPGPDVCNSTSIDWVRPNDLQVSLSQQLTANRKIGLRSRTASTRCSGGVLGLAMGERSISGGSDRDWSGGTTAQEGMSNHPHCAPLGGEVPRRWKSRRIRIRRREKVPLAWKGRCLEGITRQDVGFSDPPWSIAGLIYAP